MKLNGYSQFNETLEFGKPPIDWPSSLKALWFAAKGEWEASHNIAQDMPDRLGSWIHAHLHREEGDEFNAGYWYRRAERPFSRKSLKDELQEIVEWVLGNESY